VNIHPGAQVSEELRFDPVRQSPIWSDETPAKEAEKLCLEALEELNEYAQKRKVLLTVETICRGEQRAEDREDFYEPGNMQLNVIEEATKRGINIANDFPHAASWAREGKGRDIHEDMWEILIGFIKKTKKKTRLLHVNTLSAPFNGTDSHDGITDEDEAKGVFPNRQQLVEILSFFKDRDDVFAVPEPKANMRENYLMLKSLVDDN